MNIQNISETEYPSSLYVDERLIKDSSNICEKLRKIEFTGNLRQINNCSNEDLEGLIDVVILGTSEVLATNQDSYIDIHKVVSGIVFSYSRYRNEEETVDIDGIAIKYEHIEAVLKALDQNGEAFIASGWHDDSTWKRISIGEKNRDENESLSIRESITVNGDDDIKRSIDITATLLKRILGNTVTISNNSLPGDDGVSTITIEVEGARYVVIEVMSEIRSQIKKAFKFYK